MRTRVGYTGGAKANPTYYDLGDHTETLQIDFDPARITFEELLGIFWDSHNPARRSWSSQYKAALFYHNDTQKLLALESKTRLAAEKTGKFFNRKIHTEILPAETFYLAEDYHQKYLVILGQQKLVTEYHTIYPNFEDFVNSTAVARVNGYVGGYASMAQLEKEINGLGLSLPAKEHLRKLVQQFGR